MSPERIIEFSTLRDATKACGSERMLFYSSMFYYGNSMKSDKKLFFGFIIHFLANHILKMKTFSSSFSFPRLH